MDARSRAWAEIDRSALTHNIRLLQTRFRGRVMAVVKANAYGHGIDHIVPFCAAHGITDFGVATTDEGMVTRHLAPQASVYILAPTLPSDAPAIVEYGLIPLVSSRELAYALSDAAGRQGKTACAHLDLDTGIGRSGVSASDAPALLAELDGLPNIEVTGIATHFASADEDEDDAQVQWAKFAALLEQMGPRARSLTLHAGNSPAALVVPPVAELSLVRPGLLLYGIDPAPGMTAWANLDVRPVLSLKARVLLCRPLPAGASVSYGRTYCVPAGGWNVRHGRHRLWRWIPTPLRRWGRVRAAAWTARSPLRAGVYGSVRRRRFPHSECRGGRYRHDSGHGWRPKLSQRHRSQRQ